MNPVKRILIVGKTNSIANWTENACAAFRQAGFDTYLFSVNANGLLHRARRALRVLAGGNEGSADVGMRFERAMARVEPDLVFFTHAFWSIPREIFEALDQRDTKPAAAGWVGDKFDGTAKEKARCLDRVYFTDTAFTQDAVAYGLPDNHAYLPLAVDTALFRPSEGRRKRQMIFIANRTGNREAVVATLERGITIYGKGWKGFGVGTPHKVYATRIGIGDVAKKYRRYLATLNVKNEPNVTNGLNQRTFEPMACRSVVLNDDMKDLELCFDPGREILVYRDAQELNETYERVLKDATLASTVADAGYKRVMAEHTYAHRVSHIARDLDL